MNKQRNISNVPTLFNADSIEGDDELLWLSDQEYVVHVNFLIKAMRE